MKVVFLEEVEGTASTGDVKNVADGFARNYLLPRKLAAPATPHYLNIAEAKAQKYAKRQERLDDEATKHLLPKVEGQSLTIEVRVGDQGKLFGSVTGRDIAEALQAETGIELEHRQVALQEPIRELGARDVTIKLTKNVLATISVSVEPVGGLPATEEAPAEEPVVEESKPEAEAAVEEPEEVPEDTETDTSEDEDIPEDASEES